MLFFLPIGGFNDASLKVISIFLAKNLRRVKIEDPEHLVF